MTRSEADSVLVGNLGEVRSSLPLLMDTLRALSVDPTDPAARTEVHRLVHSLHKASAEAGVTIVSQLAACLESGLERVPAGADVPRPLVAVLAETVARFDELIRGVERGESADHSQLLARTRENLAACVMAGPAAEDGPAGSDLEDAIDRLLAEELEVPAELFAEEPDEARVLSAAQADEARAPAAEQPMPQATPVRGPLFSEAEWEQLLIGFHEEAEEHLQTLQQALQRLQTPGEDEGDAAVTAHREEIAAIRRAVHTIKGASAVIGLNEVAAYAHGVEDFLDRLHDGTRTLDPAAVAGLAEALDLLGLLVASPEQAPPTRRDTVLARLEGGGAMAEAGTTVPAVPVTGNPADLAPPAERAPFGGTTLRIQRQQLDTLIGLGNDLLANSSGLGRGLERFSTAVTELEEAANRLNTIAVALAQLSTAGTSGLPLARPSLPAGATDQGAANADPDPVDQLALIVQALGESAADAAAIRDGLEEIHRSLETDLNAQLRLARDLQTQLLQARLSPLALLTPRLRRTVADAAARLGRQVRLTVSGEQVELDRVVWEKLADPLMHLIRNAVHHGIEPPEERIAHGKEAVATLRLSGRREGDQVVIRFADDGRGLDFAAIRDKARRYDPSLCPEDMDERQLTDLIFAPGFSTRTVSEMSGRGVGLDVVRENVRDLRGTVGVATRPGVGTAFVIRLPLTMGVVRALLVESGEALWAFALSDIRQVHRVDPADISWEEGTVRLEGATLSWYSLPTLLGQVEDPVEAPRPVVLVFFVDGRSVAVSVPRLVGRQDIVLRGLGSHQRALPGVTGSAVLGEGRVVPVLDPARLIRASRLLADEDAPEIQLDISRPLTVLVVDDSFSVRRVVSRLVTSQGWRSVEARDGLEAVHQLAELWPDCIVLDLEMPRLDGFEFLARLATMPTRRNIPVIMCTSRTGRQERERAGQLGVRAFLAKPCPDEELLAAICRVTGTANAGR